MNRGTEPQKMAQYLLKLKQYKPRKGYEWTIILIAAFLTGLKGPNIHKAGVAVKRKIVLLLFITIKVYQKKNSCEIF